MFLPLLIKKLLNFSLPNCCVLCKASCNNDLNICQDCEADLPYIDCACPRCGAILTTPTKELTCCGACLNEKLPFDQTIVLFQYKNPIDYLLINLKFNQKLLLSYLLGELLAKKLVNYYKTHKKPELIIPVPLHIKRLRERGYNQALEIAKPIAHHLKIPIDKYSCIRTKNTAAQSLLPINERRNNVRRAFRLKRILNVQHVAILDDVLTTGNTVRELSKILHRAGVNKIDIWCCAKVSIRA